jgi:cephalosporin hydroxylase
LRSISLIRDADAGDLSDPERLESLLVQLGLNDEALHEFPEALHPSCGRGLRIWQYPIQFSRYLVHLSRLKIRSYLEVGVRHGGSFVATVEYLNRFCPLEFAIAVDVIDCPSMAAYLGQNPEAQFWCLNARGSEFAARLAELDALDLVFIDSHHEEDQCRAEFEILAERAGVLAFHDIANRDCPGVGRVWRAIARRPGYECFEYVNQYAGIGPFMGIGLAVKKVRLRAAELA